MKRCIAALALVEQLVTGIQSVTEHEMENDEIMKKFEESRVKGKTHHHHEAGSGFGLHDINFGAMYAYATAGKIFKMSKNKDMPLKNLHPGKVNVIEVPQLACSDGSPYHFIVIPSKNPKLQKNKLFFEFGPGGACFDQHTCATTFPPYEQGWLANTAKLVHGQDPSVLGKVPFAYIAPKESPVHDWPYVQATYCTSDLHLGNATTQYGDRTKVVTSGNATTQYGDRTKVKRAMDAPHLHHTGAQNARAVIDWTQEMFSSDPDEIVIKGGSAGGIASAMWGFHMAERYPKAQIRIITDGTLELIPGSWMWQAFFQRIRPIWGIPNQYLTLENQPQDACDLNTYILSQLKRHNGRLSLNFIEYTSDAQERKYFDYLRDKFDMEDADFDRDRIIWLRVLTRSAPPGTIQTHLLFGEGHHMARGNIDNHLPKHDVKGSLMFKPWFYKLMAGGFDRQPNTIHWSTIPADIKPIDPLPKSSYKDEENNEVRRKSRMRR